MDTELLEACRKNDTETAMRGLEEGCNPVFQDSKGWSPLMWAACNGNFELTQSLLARNAGEPYRAETLAVFAELIKRPHLSSLSSPKRHMPANAPRFTPLHWAAFKGHARIVWLLLRDGLSPSSLDELGNTAIHQAAAGGSLSAISCLLSQGADVGCKNWRGHTPLGLATDAECREVLHKAELEGACFSCNKGFSSAVLRFLCMQCQHIFCDECSSRSWVYESVASQEREKPVTYCITCLDLITKAESRLNAAIDMNELQKVEEALSSIKDSSIPANVKLVQNGQLAVKRLQAEIDLSHTLKFNPPASIEEINTALAAISVSMDKAIENSADSSLVSRARGVVRRLQQEKELRAIISKKEQYKTDFIEQVRTSLDKAKRSAASDELLLEAEKYLKLLETGKVLLDHVEQAAQTVPDANGQVLSPPQWFADNEQFRDFLLSFQQALLDGKESRVPWELLEKAGGEYERCKQELDDRIAKAEAASKKPKKSTKKKK